MARGTWAFERYRLFAATWVAIGVATAGCSGQLAGDAPTASATIALAVPSPVFTSVEVDYSVSGNGIVAVGSVQASWGVDGTLLMRDLPVGGGYRVLAREPSGCTGEAYFRVEAAKIAAVKVKVMCPPHRGGSVVVDRSNDQCPWLTGVAASSMRATVGAPILIDVSAWELDSLDSVAYIWSESGPSPRGAFADTGAADTTFTCAAAGTTALSVAVTDGVCGDTATAAIPVICLPPPAE